MVNALVSRSTDTVAPTHSYCKPGPSLSTLDSRVLAPVNNSGPHLRNLMLLLTLLDTLDDVPCITAQGLKKYLVVIRCDGMPLNIGTFPRQENGKTLFDGIVPSVKLVKMRELYQGGNTAVHKFIAENCSSILNTRTCTSEQTFSRAAMRVTDPIGLLLCFLTCSCSIACIFFVIIGTDIA